MTNPSETALAIERILSNRTLTQALQHVLLAGLSGIRESVRHDFDGHRITDFVIPDSSARRVEVITEGFVRLIAAELLPALTESAEADAKARVRDGLMDFVKREKLW